MKRLVLAFAFLGLAATLAPGSPPEDVLGDHQLLKANQVLSLPEADGHGWFDLQRCYERCDEEALACFQRCEENPYEGCESECLQLQRNCRQSCDCQAFPIICPL